MPFTQQDTHNETTNVADIFLNKNSLFCLNNKLDKSTPEYDRLLDSYKDLIQNTEKPHNYCLDTGAVMALHGLRDVNDLDYISINNKELPKSNHDIALHQKEYEAFGLSSEEIITNPKYHFICNNVKYVGLNSLSNLKKHRNTDKDNYDLSLIQYIKNKDKFVWSIMWGKFKSNIKYKIYLTRHKFIDLIASFLRKNLSPEKFEAVKSFYKKFKTR